MKWLHLCKLFERISKGNKCIHDLPKEKLMMVLIYVCLCDESDVRSDLLAHEDEYKKNDDNTGKTQNYLANAIFLARFPVVSFFLSIASWCFFFFIMA